MKTEKYNKMLSAFQCDLTMARLHEAKLSDLDKKILENDRDLLNDIDLLEELEWKIRSGKAEIVLKD